MANFEEVIKEHWEKGTFLLGAAFEAVVAFEKHFTEISLPARFFLAGLSGAVVVWSIAEMLRRERTRDVGFQAEKKADGISSHWIVFRATAILAACGFSSFVFAKTATFHNIRVIQTTDINTPSVGMIEIQPPHSPVDLTLIVATPQPGIRILEEAPASWNHEDPVEWEMQNETPFGVTLTLRDFKSPQVFGIWYRLSGRAEELEVSAIPKAAEVRVLRARELRTIQWLTWIFGGCLCAFGLGYWSYRSSWFQNKT